MEWILSNRELIVSVVVVVLAGLYMFYKGQLWGLVAEVWGLIVAEATDVLEEIPNEFFLEVGQMVYAGLPAPLKLFVTPSWIAKTLMDLRDLLVESLPPLPGTREDFQYVRGAILTSVYEYLEDTK